MSENNNNTAAGEKESRLSDIAAAAENTRKFLTFLSDGLIFGVDASYVTEIIINHNITFLPIVPYYIKGIINLRGQIIPIVDIRLRMGKPEYENPRGSNCIIVLIINSVMLGIHVDTVQQMLDIDTSRISPPTVNNCEELVSGMLTLNNGSTMLVLDNEALGKAY